MEWANEWMERDDVIHSRGGGNMVGGSRGWRLAGARPREAAARTVGRCALPGESEVGRAWVARKYILLRMNEWHSFVNFPCEPTIAR